MLIYKYMDMNLSLFNLYILRSTYVYIWIEYQSSTSHYKNDLNPINVQCADEERPKDRKEALALALTYFLKDR